MSEGLSACTELIIKVLRPVATLIPLIKAHFKKCFMLLPLGEDKWIIKPFKNQSVYKKIGFVSERIPEESTLKFINNEGSGEFNIEIKGNQFK